MIDLATIALFVSLAGLPEGEDPAVVPTQDSVLESYDLNGILPRLDGSSWEQSLLPDHLGERFGYERVRADQDFYGRTSPDVILDLVTQIIGDDLHLEGRDITLEGNGQLLLLAPPDLQARVGAFLDDLRTALSSSIELQVDILDLPTGSETAAGVLDAAAAERLVGTLTSRSESHRRLLLRLEPGRTTHQERTKEQSFVFDYDLEIAQASFSYDPIVLRAQAGSRLLLRGVPVQGGVHLSMVYHNSELLGELGDRAIGLGGYVGQEGGGFEFVNGPPNIQDAEMLIRNFAFDTYLATGKALVITCDTSLGTGDGRQVVVVRHAGGEVAAHHTIPVEGMARKLILANAEAFRPPSFSFERTATLENFSEHPSVTAGLSFEPSNFLFDWLQYRFSAWRRFGPWAVVVTDPAWDGSGAAALENLMTSTQISTDMGVVEVSLSSRAPDAPALVRLAVPARRRGNLGLLVGRTGSAIYDYDVEVAQFSSAVDPFVVPTFSGLAAVLGLGGAGERPVVDLQGSGLISSVSDSTSTMEKGRGRLDRITVQRFDFDERLMFEPGEGRTFTSRVGGTSSKGEGGELAVTVTLRP